MARRVTNSAPSTQNLSATQHSALSTQHLRVLVAAGPTREFFDSVRFISNPSTGKQGYAIAMAAAQRGHEVFLVSGPVDLPAPAGVCVIRVTTAAEMAAACKREFEAAQAAVMTAAVCDYRPPRRLPHKLSKTGDPLTLTLEPTEDICAALGRIKGDRILVGFSMDDVDLRTKAEAKLAAKNCDLMVANGPANVGADRAEVQILSLREGWLPPLAGTKAEIAEHLVTLIEQLGGGKRESFDEAPFGSAFGSEAQARREPQGRRQDRS